MSMITIVLSMKFKSIHKRKELYIVNAIEFIAMTTTEVNTSLALTID